MRLIVFTSILEQKKRSQLNFEENSLSGTNWRKLLQSYQHFLEPYSAMLGKYTQTQASSPENRVCRHWGSSDPKGTTVWQWNCSLDSQVTQRHLSGQTLLLCPCVWDQLEKQEVLVSDTHGVSRGSGLLGEVTQHRPSEKVFTDSNGS